MTPSFDSDRLDEIHALTMACLSGEASSEEVTRLENLLLGDPEARRIYAQVILDSLRLRRWAASAPELQFDAADFDSAVPELEFIDDVLIDAFPSEQNSQKSRVHEPASAPPVVIFREDPMQNAFGYFSGWPLAYMISAVLIGLSLLAASFFYVSHPDQVAIIQPTRPSSPAPRPLAVARVTGMIGCEFSDPETITFAGANVPLGRKYALSKGLMELTYDTGAKVILQGPCTYEVTAAAAGHLALGKLTARVEKKVASGEWQVASAENHKSEISNRKLLASKPSPPAPLPKGEGRGFSPVPGSPSPGPSSLSTIHYPLFTISTPTAVVTDLGTEFAVEVSKTGQSDVHVYDGEVASHSTAAGADKNGVVHLKAGQAVRMDAKNPKPVAISFSPKSFARRLPRPGEDVSEAEKAYIAAVLADRPLAYWPFNELPGSVKFTDRSGNGFNAAPLGKILERYGIFGRNSHSAGIAKSRIDLGCPEAFSSLIKDFSFEAWVQVFDHGIVERIISFDDAGEPSPKCGWGLAYLPKANAQIGATGPCLAFTSYGGPDVPINSFVPHTGQWVHVAYALDGKNVLRPFINGQPQAPVQVKPVTPGRLWGEIGSLANGKEPWCGRIAHVAVYDYLLDAEQFKRHYILATKKQTNK